MGKEQLREGLKRLDAYVRQLDFDSTFLEESALVPMDSLLIPLKIEEGPNIEISCNFVEVPDVGNILQFFGQIMLDDLLKEAQTPVMDQDILCLINELNLMLPVGQILYLLEEGDGRTEKSLGIRYTILTDLSEEAELKKCVYILMLLMQDFDLICSGLVLLLDGKSVRKVVSLIKQLIGVGEE